MGDWTDNLLNGVTVREQAAEIERLKAERDNWQETARVEHNANHTLRARVEELEAELKYDHEEYKRLRDALRAELAKAEFMRDAFQKSAIEYQAELAALKPKPVVEVVTYDYWDLSNTFTKNPYGNGRLKITFTEGKLTGAEVVK